MTSATSNALVLIAVTAGTAGSNGTRGGCGTPQTGAVGGAPLGLPGSGGRSGDTFAKLGNAGKPGLAIVRFRDLDSGESLVSN